jgi:TolB protein
MNTLKVPNKIEGRNVISFLETVDVKTGECTVLAQFDYLIEAPNWTREGKQLHL